MDYFSDKIFLLVSWWCYPFGGGEEYLYQTAKWMKSLGMEIYWISFANAKNEKHKKLEIVQEDCYMSIKIPDGLTVEKLINWIRLIKPNIIHHQGHLRSLFYQACSHLRIEFISGIHFWGGVIKLEPEIFNKDIIENSSKHTADEEILELIKKPFCTIYSVSEFVTKCVKEICKIDIKYTAYSGSLKNNCLVENMNAINNKYVTVINIHKNKGGEILLNLMKKFPEIPFIAIQTEYLSGDLDNLIREEIEKRNQTSAIQSMYLTRINNIKYIYSKTKIFLAPSLVDETFCRTVNEAMMNGIPVLTTGKGNLKYLLNHNEQYVIGVDPNMWENKVKELYQNDIIYQKAVEDMKQMYQNFSEKVCFNMFKNIVKDCLMKSKENNIMIYCPWCDQGLGIQSRNYYQILKAYNYRVHIFSFKPYNSDSCIKMQRNPEEWQVENIYYSPNDREHVKDAEILEFINKYNIGKCLIPETCWHRIFSIAKLLKDNYVKCYAIPNIEIVRKDELFKHTYFHKILCNNYLCQNIFNQRGIDNTKYIGYGIYNNTIDIRPKNINKNEIKFLFIGGMNAFSRKNILDICEGFVLASKIVSNISLTCTIQKTNLLEKELVDKINNYIGHEKIKFIQTHLSYDDIINLYYNHDISVQVSKHEGLGLGFYEAIYTGTPVITLNTAPHNEIILDKQNGWVIDCFFKKMVDNTDGLVKSAYFDPNVLSKKIIEIVNTPNEIETVCKKLFIDYTDRLHIDKFSKTFIDSIKN